jgi:hypothetical protein
LLTLRQRSMFWGFHYEVVDPSGLLLADLIWPTYTQARNARLKWHKPGSSDGDLTIRTAQGDFRIGFEYLTRAFTNDVRFFLNRGDEPLAMADVLFPEGLRRHEIFLRQPSEGRLIRANRWGRVGFRVELAGKDIGSIEEPHWFSLRRQLRLNLPAAMPMPQQAFLGFLALNSAFR